MIMKFNYNKLENLSQRELNNLKVILIQLEGLTPKTDGGITEIFTEKTVKDNLSFEDLYRKIGDYQLNSDINSNFHQQSKVEIKDEKETKETDMYISSVNRSYVS